jgi:hypothetical protein
MSSTSPEMNGSQMFKLRRISRAFSELVAEDRDGFKRIDASPAKPDDGAWLRIR